MAGPRRTRSPIDEAHADHARLDPRSALAPESDSGLGLLPLDGVAGDESRSPGVPKRTARRRARRVIRPLEQLAFNLGADQPLWTFSRFVQRSPHLRRIREHLEFVRRFFPELDATTVRVGLVRKRGIMGWGSLDPERPGVWVRPRRLDYFTIAHEFTHLLQARGLVPHGERSCDLYALARSALLVDAPPGYLRMPKMIRDRARLEPEQGKLLHELAKRAVEAREQGDRCYLMRFEQAAARAFGESWKPKRRRRVP